MQNDAISKKAHVEFLESWKYADPDPKDDYMRGYNAAISDAIRHAKLNAPALDVAPVVRCKDCRYSEPMPDRGVSRFGADALNCTQCRGDDGYGYAGISMIRPDDFCSDGALKDGEPHD